MILVSCQGEKAEKWLAEQQARLLPCVYFMVTFTVPAKFRRFVRSHPRECYQALFEAARQATVKLAKDPRYLGAGTLGMTAVLHTWGRDLNYHPHVHFIIPGGAISKSGREWLASRSDFLVPVKALSKIFRAKYRELMRKCGLLSQICRSVWSEPWIVNSQAVGDGRTSLRYLAPYVFRVAIGNFRVVSVTSNADGTGLVTFLVKPSGSRTYRKMTVTVEEFLRRFLQHVLPSGFQKVRHYGFMHKRSKVSPTWLAMLVTVTLNMVYQLIVDAPVFKEKRAAVCQDCGGELQYLGWLRSIDAFQFPIDSS